MAGRQPIHENERLRLYYHLAVNGRYRHIDISEPPSKQFFAELAPSYGDITGGSSGASYTLRIYEQIYSHFYSSDLL
jgi:hypothetical protein